MTPSEPQTAEDEIRKLKLWLAECPTDKRLTLTREQIERLVAVLGIVKEPEMDRIRASFRPKSNDFIISGGQEDRAMFTISIRDAQRLAQDIVDLMPDKYFAGRPQQETPAENAQAPTNQSPMLDTPLKQAIRTAFDNPTLGNIERVAFLASGTPQALPSVITQRTEPCTCYVVTGGQVAISQRCPIHGRPVASGSAPAPTPEKDR